MRKGIKSNLVNNKKMEILAFIIAGLFGGILGGMGMGGGTLLIPILLLATSLSQHTAQAINLIAFIPMGIVILIMHIKNGLVKVKYIFLISLPAVLVSVGASFFAKFVEGASIGKYFVGFLLVLGIYQLSCCIAKIYTDRKKRGKIFRRSFFS